MHAHTGVTALLLQAGLKPKPKVGLWHAGGAGDMGRLRQRAFDRGLMSTVTDAVLKVVILIFFYIL